MTAQQDKPFILYENINTFDDLKNLKISVPVWSESDVYEQQLKELFQVTFPHLLFSHDYRRKLDNFICERTAPEGEYICGNWIYFPWNGRLVHALNERDYFQLRTNRNRNLVTEEEQRVLSDFTIGIAGLSVGSNVATALAYSGAAGSMKLAEHDILETSNLNRIRARVDQVGVSKIELTVQQIYEINPYAQLVLYSQGLNKQTLKEFVVLEPKPKLIFEIIDSFEIKIHLRSLTSKEGIPVVMVTNLGDGMILDVERYDLDKNTVFFNGRAGEVPDKILKNPDSADKDRHRYAVQLAGEEHIPERALQSVMEIGKTLVGRPQFTTTVTVAAGLCGYIARRIALGDSTLRGSWYIKFDEVFSSSHTL